MALNESGYYGLPDRLHRIYFVEFLNNNIGRAARAVHSITQVEISAVRFTYLVFFLHDVFVSITFSVVVKY